jgi:hypothetical protein
MMEMAEALFRKSEKPLISMVMFFTFANAKGFENRRLPSTKNRTLRLRAQRFEQVGQDRLSKS